MRAKPETPTPAPAARSETPAAPPRAVESVPKLPPFEQVFPDLKPSGKEAPGATPEPDPLESLEEEFARLVRQERRGAREGITHEGRAVGGNPAPSRRVVSRAAIRASCFCCRKPVVAACRRSAKARSAPRCSSISARTAAATARAGRLRRVASIFAP